MKNDRFILGDKIKKFIKLMNKYLVNYPRSSFNLKNRIENTSYDLLELVTLTNLIDDRKLNQKIILSKISMLDYYLELSYNYEYISLSVLNKGCKSLDEIRKITFGWINAS